MNELEKLLYLRRISADYINFSGERVVVPFESRLKYLQAAGYDVGDDTAINQAIFELDALPWQSWLQPFNIISLGETEHIDIRVQAREKHNRLKWRVNTELGQSIEGTLVPAELPEVGDYYIGNSRYSAHRQALPDLPLGYHHIKVWNSQSQASARLVVAPARCFEISSPKIEANKSSQAPPATTEQMWGISCQLYTLRSERNWGMGDFGDLLELIECVAAVGMDFVSINPLHAPLLSGEDFASPYSPSDRRFLNTLYIDPQRVDEFYDSEKIHSLINGRYKQNLKALRQSKYVDYKGVAELKYAVFAELYQIFVQQHLEQKSTRAKAFLEFVHNGGETLQAFSSFESNHTLANNKVTNDAQFHQYLQFIADEQLQQCQLQALAAGMSVGVMGDLAVGAEHDGAEFSSKPGLSCKDVTIGAPPDPFAEQGQNWNLAALDPIALERDDYQHFIELLRANMKRCGALRIDHVMSMLRLWWCLPEVKGGTYIYYPLETLWALLRLESHRSQCIIIGEDMGLVPDEVRTKMAATAVYGNKLFYFERHADRQFKPPSEHHRDALLMVSNHDVSPLAGWWDVTDLQLQIDLHLLHEETELSTLLQHRQQAKHDLLIFLGSQQLLPESWTAGELDSLLEKPFDFDLCSAILIACARSHSRMMSFQLEDLQLLQEPVNIPGTFKEYPNWRRKQSLHTKAIFQNSKVQELLVLMKKERKR